MKLEEVINRIQTTKKGTYTPIVYQTIIPSNKNYKNIVVTKVTRAIVRLGCEYDNLKSVQLANAATLSLGVEQKATTRDYKWLLDKNGESLYPYLYEGRKGANLRCTVAHNVHYKAAKILGYYANGVEITQEQARIYTQNSPWDKKSRKLDVFDKNIDDIISIGE